MGVIATGSVRKQKVPEALSRMHELHVVIVTHYSSFQVHKFPEGDRFVYSNM